jgi:hypothetical protein
MPLGNDGWSFAAPQVIQDRKRAIGRHIGTGIRSIGGQVGIVRVPGNWRRDEPGNVPFRALSIVHREREGPRTGGWGCQRQHAGWRR